MKLLFLRSQWFHSSISEIFAAVKCFQPIMIYGPGVTFPSQNLRYMVKANSVTFLTSGDTARIFCLVLLVFSEAETEKMVNVFSKVLDNLVLEKSVYKSWLCHCFFLWPWTIYFFCMYETWGYYISHFQAWYKNSKYLRGHGGRKCHQPKACHFITTLLHHCKKKRTKHEERRFFLCLLLFQQAIITLLLNAALPCESAHLLAQGSWVGCCPMDLVLVLLGFVVIRTLVIIRWENLEHSLCLNVTMLSACAWSL